MDIAKLIQKRFKLLFNLNIGVTIKKFTKEKIFSIHANQNFKINLNKKKIYFEIDQILKNIKYKI